MSDETMRDHVIQIILATSHESEGATADALMCLFRDYLPKRKPSLDRTREAFNQGLISEFERGVYAGWNDCLDAIERGE